MALDTFGGLKTAIADWAWGEVTTTLIGSDFFPRMQSKMYFGDGAGTDGLVQIKPLRIRAMIDSATITPSASGQVTISTGVDTAWLEFISLTPTNVYGKSLDYLDYWEFKKRADLQVAGAPEFYSIEGDTLYTGPYSSSTIAAIYYQKFTALSADGDVDWVLTNAPQVYMDGCLMEICAYLQDTREGEFRQKFAAGINALNHNNRIAKMSGAVKRSVPRAVA